MKAHRTQNTELITSWTGLFFKSSGVGTFTFILGQFLVFTFITIQPEKSFGKIAGASLFLTASPFVIVTMTLFYAPIIETLIGQLFPIEIVRRWTSSAVLQILISATIFGAGHGLGGGGGGQIALTFTCSIPLATLYVFFRSQGILKSNLAVMLSHAFTNGLTLVTSFYIVPLLN